MEIIFFLILTLRVFISDRYNAVIVFQIKNIIPKIEYIPWYNVEKT